MLVHRRTLLVSGLGLALQTTPALAAGRHSLIMVETASCTYCVQWHREVGPGYAKSSEGAFAPLRRFQIGDPALRGIRDLRYTPTFVLMDADREIGRIVGYPGADFFWGLLAELLAKAGFSAAEPTDIKT